VVIFITLYLPYIGTAGLLSDSLLASAACVAEEAGEGPALMGSKLISAVERRFHCHAHRDFPVVDALT
jgi:hypothetical protein